MIRTPSCIRRGFAIALIAFSAVPVAAAARPPAVQADRLRAAVAAAIDEASRRFGVPADWIWQIVRVESGGEVGAVSWAGAMGLMQIMPKTYAALRRRYGLGTDPFDVRDNILAGAAYLRELHDRYGPYGMLAAYNGGPGRWEDHLATGRPLPNETRRYLARLAPAIAPGAATVSPTPLVAPPPSPLSAPIFVTRTAVALPVTGAQKRVWTNADAQSTVGAAASPATHAPQDRSSNAAPPLDIERPIPPRSGTLFVAPSSQGASR